jgi:NAD(P)-dependent dehydrogenase (short-subunit alcohol dehydrogenase family)
MKTVVITGSTRGIGNGLADAFLSLGCAVVVSGRTEEGVATSVETLASKHGGDKVYGYPCDVTEVDQIQALWDAAKDHFGRIDVWINNAGVGHPINDVWDLATEKIHAVVDTNIKGMIFGSKVAIRGMMEQGGGSLYIMEGMGYDGRKHDGLALYGMSKYGMNYLIESLVEETQDSPVLVGSLRPGMVATEFITDQYIGREDEWERTKPILNVLADRVETVTPWLANEILNNEKHGATITWLTKGKLMGRFLMSRFRKREVFD